MVQSVTVARWEPHAWSVHIEAGRYERLPRTLIQYIDANPIRAGIVTAPEPYPYGSAYYYARARGPAWLERSWIERVVRDECEIMNNDAGSYGRVFREIPEDLVEIVEARLARRLSEDPLDNLVTASPDRVRRWMVRKARLADGTEPDLPIAALSRLAELVAAKRQEPWTLGCGWQRRNAWPVVHAGLGRTLCGASLARLARALDVSHSTGSKLCQIHSREL